MWIKSIDDEFVNLDNIVEIRVKHFREKINDTVIDQTFVIAYPVNDRAFTLWQHEGEAVEMAKRWINIYILKTRGDTNDKA